MQRARCIEHDDALDALLSERARRARATAKPELVEPGPPRDELERARRES
jgi:hypothetical protein